MRHEDRWSEVCVEGRHIECQGHGIDGPCHCDAPSHAPKQAAAHMRDAARLLRTDPVRAGVALRHAELLADQMLAASEDLAGAIQHVKRFGGDPFEVVDEPGSVRRALRFARSVNSTTGDPS